MAHVPPAPRTGRSYDGDRRDVLAELGRIDREQPPVRPGSVQSTDGSVIRIPGPLDDVGRDGHTLVYDEDLHQPVWRPAASGGIVGMAEVSATNGTVSMPAGQQFIRDSVTYTAPYDPFADTEGASLVAVSSWCSIDPDVAWMIRLSPGWYNLALSVRVWWSAEADAPPSFGAYMQGGYDTAHNDSSYFPRTKCSNAGGGRWGLQQVMSQGPTYITPDVDVHAEVTALSAAGADNLASNSAIVWSITKLS